MTVSPPKRQSTETHAPGAEQPYFSILPQPAPWLLGGMPAPPPMASPAALIGLSAIEAGLRTSRAFLDVSRTMIRQQQDAILSAWRAQLTGATGETPPRSAGAGGQEVLAPWLAMAEAYGRVGAAALEAQRRAVEAMTRNAEAH